MNNVGRPKKYTTQELKHVIDSYVSKTNGLYKINATKVASYGAEVLGLRDLRYYVFNRNEEVKQYIKHINQLIHGGNEDRNSLGDKVFSSLDIQAYCKLSTSDLAIALENLNQYINSIINSNTKILAENTRLKEEITNYSLKELSSQKNSLEQESILIKERELLEENIEKAKSDIKKLKSEKEKLETAISILWEQEATDVLKRLGLIAIEDDSSIESKLIVDNAKEDICKIEESLNSMKSFQQKDTLIALEFKNKIRNL